MGPSGTGPSKAAGAEGQAGIVGRWLRTPRSSKARLSRVVTARPGPRGRWTNKPPGAAALSSRGMGWRADMGTPGGQTFGGNPWPRRMRGGQPPRSLFRAPGSTGTGAVPDSGPSVAAGAGANGLLPRSRSDGQAQGGASGPAGSNPARIFRADAGAASIKGFGEMAGRRRMVGEAPGSRPEPPSSGDQPRAHRPGSSSANADLPAPRTPRKCKWPGRPQGHNRRLAFQPDRGALAAPRPSA